MTVLTQFFCKMYFLYVSRGRKNFLGEILWVLPLQKPFFSQPLGSSWVLQKLRIMRGLNSPRCKIKSSSRSAWNSISPYMPKPREDVQRGALFRSRFTFWSTGVEFHFTGVEFHFFGVEFHFFTVELHFKLKKNPLNFTAESVLIIELNPFLPKFKLWFESSR